jgi:hypothetical protein
VALLTVAIAVVLVVTDPAGTSAEPRSLVVFSASHLDQFKSALGTTWARHETEEPAVAQRRRFGREPACRTRPHRHPRALSEQERWAMLATLHSERILAEAPAQVVSRLLDGGR